MIYRSKRIGKGGKEFVLYKLRTMSEHGGTPTASTNDPRLTKIGKWLRRWKIDEIPTIWNLIKGDIIVCSYRPDTVEEIETLSEDTKRLLFKFKPGIISPATLYNYKEDETLSAQENPHAYYCKVIKPIKYFLNRWYLTNKTPWLDFKIFLAFCLKLVHIPYLWLDIYPKEFHGKIEE